MERQYVYGFIQRLLHWWLALATILLMTTGVIASQQEPNSARAYMQFLHMTCGRALAVGLVGRLLWLLIGPSHAHIKSFFHPAVWVQSIKSPKMLSADGKFGHNEQASASYLGYYGLVVCMAITGFFLAAVDHGEGPLADLFLDDFRFQGVVREVHEVGWYLIAGFAVTHILAMVYHEYRDKIPITQSMLSGFQYRTNKEVTRDQKKP